MLPNSVLLYIYFFPTGDVLENILCFQCLPWTPLLFKNKLDTVMGEVDRPVRGKCIIHKRLSGADLGYQEQRGRETDRYC